MNTKLLTIAIPTFNRVDTLSLLLKTLLLELSELENHVAIIISDNASLDRTSDVTTAFKNAWPSAIVIRHEINIGPDENFCTCIEQVRTKYFWLIGDDDLPKIGTIRKIVELLIQKNPDLVYINSEWSNDIMTAAQGIQVDQLTYKEMNQIEFASRVNVYFTFISGIIINRDTFLRTTEILSIRQYIGTSLVQLGWVLKILKDGQSFVYINDPCILAKAANSGGYAVLTVFSENMVNIVNSIFGAQSIIAKKIIWRAVVGYLPSLTWNVRFNNIGIFNDENAWKAFRKVLYSYVYFWIILTPITLAPKPIAFVFKLIAFLMYKIIKVKDNIFISK